MKEEECWGLGESWLPEVSGYCKLSTCWTSESAQERCANYITSLSDSSVAGSHFVSETVRISYMPVAWNHVEEPTYCDFLTKCQVTASSLVYSDGTSLDTDLGGTSRGYCLERIQLSQVVDLENSSFSMR